MGDAAQFVVGPPPVPLQRLLSTPQPSAALPGEKSEDVIADLCYSIRLTIKSNGTVPVVGWNGWVYKSGFRNGAKMMIDNGAPFNVDLLNVAITNAASNPINFGFKLDGQVQVAHIDYHGPLRHPHLQRIPESKDQLVPLLQAKPINAVSMLTGRRRCRVPSTSLA